MIELQSYFQGFAATVNVFRDKLLNGARNIIL